MKKDVVTLDRLESIATITLSRPENANSINLQLAQALRAAVAEADADDALRVLIIRGEGKFFCAGGDVDAIFAAPDPADYLSRLTDEFHRALLQLRTTSLVVLAAVNGTVAGGGLGLLLSCDLTISSPSASFVGAFASIGLTPDSGVSALLPRSIGDRRASSVLLGGKILDAATAETWGLVSEVTELADFDERVLSLASHAAKGARIANGETKRLLRASWETSYRDQLADEGRTISAAASSSVSRALVSSFLHRRSR